MLKKAVQEHNPMLSGLKNSTSSQNYNAIDNTLKPRSSSVLNTAYPTPARSLKRTASQASGRGSPSSSEDQGLKRAMLNHPQPSIAGGRLEKLHGPVFFDENDFEDDEDINLDADDSPIASESMSSGASSTTLLPDLPQKKSPIAQTPVSSTPLPWSSSPLSHHQMPPPKPSTRKSDTTSTTKRRTLPWLEEEKQADQARRERSDRFCEELTGGVPPTSSEQAIIDQKKQWKEKKLLDRQCVDLTGGELAPRNQRQISTEDPQQLERYREGMLKRGVPDWVVERAVEGKKR